MFKTKKKEYLVHCWGGAWNSDANPSIEKDLGIKEGYYYFDTEKEKNAFCTLLEIPKYSSQGLVKTVDYGFMTHKRTIFVGTFKYHDEEFILHYDFGYDFKEANALYMFEHGNYSCDCNRSIFIRNEYGEDAIPELGCGWEIKLVKHHFEYAD